MFRYADPEACPVCRAQIDFAAVHCTACGADFSGRQAETLWRTLTHADGLVAEMMRLAAGSTEARTATTGVASGVGVGVGTGQHQFEAYPRPHDPRAEKQARPTPGLTSASVPRILLGLGAGCLLVAAIVFLIVAWAAFGQTGRTLTLLAMTATAAVAAYWVTRQGLRAGAESLGTVALGLLVLDVFGAHTAGWFGEPGFTGFLPILGTSVGVTGLAAGLVVRQGGTLPRLVSGEVFGAVGVITASGWTLRFDDARSLGFVAVTLAMTFTALGLRRIHLPIAAGILAVGAGAWWLALFLQGASRIDDTTVTAVWGGAACWPLLAAAAIALLPTVLRLPLAVRVLAAGTTVSLVALVLTLPAVDESMSEVALVSLTVLAVGVAACLFLTMTWRRIVLLPVLVATLLLFGTAAQLVGHATDALFDFVTWTATPVTRLPTADLAWHQPLVLAPAVFGVLVGTWALARMVVEVQPRPLLRSLVLTGLSPLALLPALYAAPVALAVGVLLLLLAVQLALAARPRGDALLRVVASCLAVATACTALGASLANEVLTAGTTGLFAAVALVLACSATVATRMTGEILLPPLLAGCLWSVLHLATVEENLRVPVVLVGVGAWAIARPRWWTELSVLLTGLVTAGFALALPGGADQTWLAVDLTVGGVVVAISALLHPFRRELGWLSLALFTAAQWVRMNEVGVTTVEAYTLPLAVVLLAVGSIRLRMSNLSSLRALGSGLTLALLPTLLLALVDPVSLRAVLLGMGCAVAITIGAGMRWSAPLLAGAGTAALLVLREATYAQMLPQWVTLALIGLLLTAVGATWERRVNELRLATGYVRRLR